MTPTPNLSMNINDHFVNVTKIDGEDYICLTDMARSAGSDRALHSWLRARNTILFLGLWEQTHNQHFNLHEFVKIKNRAGENSFNPSIKEWVETTSAIGIISKTGRYGIILANLESLNSHLISEKKSQSERIATLAKEARRQYEALIAIEEIEDERRKVIE